MRTLNFARRNFKEILRDPLSLIFGLGFPLVLLLLLTAINRNVPAEVFTIEALTPGVAVFGLSFLSLFSALLIARDRSSAFMARVMASPMTAWDFILGYTLPLLPMALVQLIVCYGAAFCLGLPVTANALWSLAAVYPMSLFFVAMGLLFGTILNDKQVGGICGALLTNLSAWLSGAWFDPAMVGGAFEAAAKALPFLRAVLAGRAAMAGEPVFPHLAWVLAYAAVFLALAVAVFYRRMRQGKI